MPFSAFLPGSVPCAPCAMRTHRTASQQSLVRRTCRRTIRRTCRRTSGICRRGLPCTPFFCVSGQTKNVAAHHFCRAPLLVLRAQCALTALRHSGCLSAAHVAVQAGFAAGGSPAPRFCISGQTKNVAAHHFCRAPFLVLRPQCALTALRCKNFFVLRPPCLFVQQIGAAFSCDLQRLFRAPGVHLLVVARDQYVGDG